MSVPTPTGRLSSFIFALNLVATLLLAGSLILAYLWPEQLAYFHLTTQTSQMVNLNLISLLLLLAWLQRNLTTGWRIFALVGAFVVLVESWLVALV